MMTLKLQIIIGIIIVTGLLYIISLIRGNRLELKHAISWLSVGTIVLILDCAPMLMDKLAKLFGIAAPVNMMFSMAFIFSLIIILTMSVALSIASSSVKRLVQKVALLDKKVLELEEKLKEKE